MSIAQTTTVPMSNVRWKIFILLLTLVSLNYIDRAALSVSMPLISREFHMTPVVQGLILSSFFWTYLFMQIPSGVLVDRFKPRAVLSGGAVIWGFFQVLVMFTTGWFTLMLTRFGLGIAEAPIYPAGTKLSALWLTQNERTRGASMIDGGSALGSGFGAIITTALIGWLSSWRLAFLITGMGTVLCGLFAWWFIRNHPHQHPLIGADEVLKIQEAHAREDQANQPAADKTLAIHFLRFRSVWCTFVAHTCTNLIFYGLMTWLPTYLFAVHHFKLSSMGNATFVIFLCGFVGEILVGQIADRWRTEGGAPNVIYRTLLAIGACVIAASLFLVSYVSQPDAVVVLLCLAVFFVRWNGGCIWTVPALLATRNRTGVLAGMMNFVGNIAGIFVPILIGFIVGMTGSYFLALMFFVAVAVTQLVMAMLINYQRRLPV